ncbi:MADS-box transcription factor 27-like [Triticum aestivum]|uniref:MADS-box transcription factor 27-like n=1 Tax=Triticum aestivum TaxID=4565 RepID=UPI001D018CF9|nr:MADS-box transcription factor 27-like [Triticum aestivum]
MVRGKAVIERIENTTSRQVTFSKRKSGLFKKARELGVLCDAQVAVLLFSNTGRLYDYSNSNSGMKSIIERYQHVKEGQQFMSASAEAKFWQAEGVRLRQQLHNLQENHRQLLGQHLSGLGLEDLRGLENQLETSIHNIRLTKDQLMIDETEELKKKASLVHQENIELHKKLNIIRQENIDLQNKLNGQAEVNGTITSSSSEYYIAAREDPVRLELSYPDHAERDEQPESPTLGDVSALEAIKPRYFSCELNLEYRALGSIGAEDPLAAAKSAGAGDPSDVCVEDPVDLGVTPLPLDAREAAGLAGAEDPPACMCAGREEETTARLVPLSGDASVRGWPAQESRPPGTRSKKDVRARSEACQRAGVPDAAKSSPGSAPGTCTGIRVEELAGLSSYWSVQLSPP